MAQLQITEEPVRHNILSLLPDDLLRTCLGFLSGDGATQRAALAACKPFASAVVRASFSSLSLVLEPGARGFAQACRLAEELWGDQQQLPPGKCTRLVLWSKSATGSPGRCVDELRGAGVRLPFITRLQMHVRAALDAASSRRSTHTCKGSSRSTQFSHRVRPQCLVVDVLLPPGTAALLPNLQQVEWMHCTLTPAAKTTLLDTACGRLRQVDISGLTVAAPSPGGAPPPQRVAVATAQLRQLAKLPSLDTVFMWDDSCPTLFLLALGTQLTRLRVDDDNRRPDFDTREPTPAWWATLEQVSRCTRLRDLSIPCGDPEELDLVAPALQGLRQLSLTCPEHVGDDTTVELLLGLPHLTSLHWRKCTRALARWHNDRRCGWEELTFGAVSPSVLARLPLRSLRRPVRWNRIRVDCAASAREVRAAVANVTRPDRCPAGFKWVGYPMRLTMDSRLPVADVLAGLAPLLAGLGESFMVRDVRWGAGCVEALGRALPRTCTRLELSFGAASDEALEQVAASLPWLRHLRLSEMDVLPSGAVAFARRWSEGGGAAQLEEVVVQSPWPAPGVSEAQSRRAWGEAVCEAGRVGVKVDYRPIEDDY